MYSSLQQKKRICNVNKLIQSKMNTRFMKFITTYTTKLDWYTISYNQNLTMEMIIANPTKPWDWYGISSHKFIKDKEAIREIECKKHLAAYKIQTMWRNALVNPYCKVGINRINRDYDIMYNNNLI